jgi:hypothetical protein
MYGLGDALQPDPAPKDPKKAAFQRLIEAVEACQDAGYLVAFTAGDTTGLSVVEYGPVKGFMKALKEAKASRKATT